MIKWVKAAVVGFDAADSETDLLEISEVSVAVDVAFDDDPLDLPLHSAGGECCGTGSGNGGDKIVQWLGVESSDFLPTAKSQMQQD